tara:strand:- start:484 stop:759 length:276 start_codon:yes stop_codon:yes gene_type:complete
MSDPIIYYSNLASFVKSDTQKIKFFNQYQKAFFLDYERDEFENALKEYIKKENLSESDSEEIQDMKWEEMPDSFKLFAFQCCITEGSAYIE